MNQAHEKRDARYFGIYVGSVVDTDDPLKLNRVKVQVPGLLKPASRWCRPLGAMFGVKNGVSWTPEKDSNVVVLFNQGDVDHPYYIAGSWGAPGGQSDVPEQTAGNPDKLCVRWRDFHVTIDGTPGSEKVTIEDLQSTTKLEIERSSGNFTREVSGDEQATIAKNLTETVVTGNETHAVAAGGRTTAVAQNDQRTVGGNVVDTITGLKTETVAGALSSETVTGAKSVVAGLAVTITAGAAMILTAGGAVSLVGSGVTIQSLAAGTQIIAGLMTSNFLGGLIENVTGDDTRNVSGVCTINVVGLFNLLSAAIALGVAVNAKKLVNRDVFSLWANSHTHAGPGAPPDQKVLPGGMSPDVDEALVTTQNVTAS
jgi:hypothetical protein